jgi:Mg2+-importing ATPase
VHLPLRARATAGSDSIRQRAAAARADRKAAYWQQPLPEIVAALHTRLDGLTSAQAAQRLADIGPNELRAQTEPSRWRALWGQLRSPLLALLIFAAIVSALSGEWVDSALVLAILGASVAIGYFREYRANLAAAQLRERIHARATVLRDGAPRVIPLREAVPGDVAVLCAGSVVPADGVLLQACDLFVNESVLTGESFPVEKKPGIANEHAPLASRTNCLYLGTNVRSGTGRLLIVRTGTATEFGAVAQRLTLRPPETDFDRGIRRFGYLLTIAMFIIVVCVFAINVTFGRQVGETLLFAVALAVGLSPELLPAILSVNLARAAQMMASRGVLVRHLNAIENLGSMDVLCTDKTGTLTEGIVRLEGAFDAQGARSEEVLRLAAVNSSLQTGLANPLDEAILQAHAPDTAGIAKLAEIPYDFVRKRMTVIVRQGESVQLITKGAVENVLSACAFFAAGQPLQAADREALRQRVLGWNEQGIRVLAVAVRSLEARDEYDRRDEFGLTLMGFLTFQDRPKAGAAEAIADLSRCGVRIKLISGDAKPVVQHVAREVGISSSRVLTGKDLDDLHDEALWHAAERTDLFAEVDPNQKERIILSLKKMQHVVGFLGDGVNDAPAMHAADTSISVESAVDVARDAADFVLLERNLDVLRQGIDEGRRTFANTLKYILTTTSANLGNMVSMAIASLFLPFLPLLPTQVLLNNFLSDIPAIGLATDAVDREFVEQPRRWDMRFIGRFMVQFGLLSSVFDFLAFGALLFVFAAGPELFRTGWFVESLITELAIALVVRTRRSMFQSRPGTLLIVLSVAVGVLCIVLPYLPFAGLLGFVPLPPAVLAAMAGITVLYVLAVEAAKRRLYVAD